MKLHQFLSRGLTPLLFVFAAGCGGGLDPVLGTPPITVSGLAPTVTATSPAASTPPVTGVGANSSVFATFSKPMDDATLTSGSFYLECPGAPAVDADVSYDAATQVARLTPDASLPANTTCTATVTTAARDTTGFALAANHVWSFVTGVAPTVTATSPVDSTPPVTGVATNSRVFATFSKPMDGATLIPASFYLECPGAPAVDAAVLYNAASQVATLTPDAALPMNTICQATVTTAARDTTGFAFAADHVWSFVTGGSADTTAPTSTDVNPSIGSTGVCRSTTVYATFDEPMDAVSINTSTFTVTSAGVAVPGTVSYDAATRRARFTPTNASGFDAGTNFVATVVSGASGVKDVAGNPLAADVSWGFQTGTQACASAVNLRTAAAFGAFGGGAGVTNQGPNTVVGGSLGTTAACTLITGFHDASNSYTEVAATNIGAVSGTITCGPPAPGTTTSLAVATQARADAQTAYNELAAMPPGGDPGAGQLGGLVLPPGVYTSAGGTFAITTGDLTLDAQGDANAVWVFQSAAGLTVGLSATPRTVFLINGAEPANVFWQVGSAARIEDGSTMVGTIIAPAGVTISTAGQAIQTTLTGRAIGLTASVTMVNTTVVAP